MAAGRNSNTQILQELEALSETLYTTRRTASLALPRSTAIPSVHDQIGPPDKEDAILTLNPTKPRSRRMSLSPWRSRPNQEQELPINNSKGSSSTQIDITKKLTSHDEPAAVSEKKGFLSWKPIRALAHIGMQKLSCLFSVEVVTVQSLPTSMNGLRLSVCVRKKETKDGVVQTMPSRVSQGAADFEETLFIRCHVYYTPAGSSGTHMKFEPRPFLVYVIAVDAEELDFGRSAVDLTSLIQESIDKSFEGTRIRQWDTSFSLSGKAKGGELVLKLGFQIMEKDGGTGIYSQAEGKKHSPSFARKQSKSSFSVPSPRMSSRAEAWTPSQKGRASDFQEMDDLNLDEPPPPVASASRKTEEIHVEAKMDDVDLLDFDVVDKGVEKIEDKKDEEEDEEQSEGNSSDKRSVSSEVVKEVVQDQSNVTKRLTELDLIAQQIKALESMMGEENTVQKDEETASQALDAEEDKLTREFLQMLEGDGEDDKLNVNYNDEKIPPLKHENEENVELEEECDVLISDLGKGLGSVVQTRNGGYLAAMNPLDNVVARKDTPKLAMQLSKPLLIQSKEIGFEMFQKMAGIGVKELTSEMSSLMLMDELMGKTAEQIAFEGIASAIIQGRNKEGASSSAARTIAAVKSMANAMSTGRKERVSTGIWNVSEDPLTVDEILAFSMQKIENMAIEALKIEADMAEEDAPFDLSPLDAKTVGSDGKVYNHLFASAIPIDDWIKLNENLGLMVTISVIVQLRDPMRQYEAVGGPMIALIHATGEKFDRYNEKRYKVASLQVGGVKVKSLVGIKNVWDSEKQRLTAMQWLVANGFGKRGKHVFSKGPDLLWSIVSRVMADMWLKPIRNPDVKLITE